jgi:hypothetical protein
VRSPRSLRDPDGLMERRPASVLSLCFDFRPQARASVYQFIVGDLPGCMPGA